MHVRHGSRTAVIRIADLVHAAAAKRTLEVYVLVANDLVGGDLDRWHGFV